MPATFMTFSDRPSAVARVTALSSTTSIRSFSTRLNRCRWWGALRISATWMHCLASRTSRHRRTSSARHKSASSINTARASIGKVDDETGHLWSVLAHVYEAEGEFTPSLLGKFDVGWPLPLSHRPSGCAPAPAFRRATAPTRSPTLTSAASATIMSTMATPSVIASY